MNGISHVHDLLSSHFKNHAEKRHPNFSFLYSSFNNSSSKLTLKLSYGITSLKYLVQNIKSSFFKGVLFKKKENDVYHHLIGNTVRKLKKGWGLISYLCWGRDVWYNLIWRNMCTFELGQNKMKRNVQKSHTMINRRFSNMRDKKTTS